MKKLLTAGIILALVGSNFIIGKSYMNDSKEYESRIKNKNKLIKQYKINKHNDISLIRNKSLEILILRQQVTKQQKQIEQLQKELSNHSPPKTVFEVTAYTSGYESTQKRKGDVGYGITASGTYVNENKTIACPQTLPFGTKVNIQGIGLMTCEDRGNRITENHIDLYVASLSEAIQFGRKKLLVEILN